MVKLHIEVEGVDKVIAAAKKKGKDARAALLPGLEAGAELIKAAAAANAPRRSGALSESMIHEVITKESTKDSIVMGVGPHRRVWYARFVEYGTSAHDVAPVKADALVVAANTYRDQASHPGTVANPFLRPALDENEEAAQKAIAKVMKAALELD